MTLADDLAAAFLTSGLTDAQRGELIDAGEEQRFAPGDELFVEGRPADVLVILLEGEVELVRHTGHQATVVAKMDTPGQWAGGLMAWGGAESHSVFRATARVVHPARTLTVPSEAIGRLVGEWSPFAKHMITGVFQTVSSIDASARERESLVALGTLAAGLAHEINNPASAALRSVEALYGSSGDMLRALAALAERSITAETYIEIERLRNELARRPALPGDGLAAADREEELGDWMDDRGVDGAWLIAPVLASAAADVAWLDELDAVAGDAIEAALAWASSTAEASALLSELAEATRRISHLVEDVKTYSQLDRAELQHVELGPGIRSTLAMLAGPLGSVDVVVDLPDDLPPVEVYAAELNQVWTNLIDNAIDAMDGQGTLTISARVDGDAVIVEVGDTGPGMAPDVLARAFDPFFTTKDVGEGTGLGLDITRRIVVDRHGGEISFASSPGSTVASVRLPLSR